MHKLHLNRIDEATELMQQELIRCGILAAVDKIAFEGTIRPTLKALWEEAMFAERSPGEFAETVQAEKKGMK